MVLIDISLMINNVEHLSICFLACVMSIHIFFPFSFWVVCLIESFVDIMKSFVRHVLRTFTLHLCLEFLFFDSVFLKAEGFFHFDKIQFVRTVFYEKKICLIQHIFAYPKLTKIFSYISYCRFYNFIFYI